MQKLKFYPFEQLNPVWSPEEQEKITQLLQTKHSVYLIEESFHIETGFNKEQVQLKVTLSKNDQSMTYPIEILCPLEDTQEKKVSEIASILMDYIDVYWNEFFFEERNLFLPIDWAHNSCEGLTFFLRGFIRNLSLEMQADKLLKEFGHGEHDISPITSET